MTIVGDGGTVVTDAQVDLRGVTGLHAVEVVSRRSGNAAAPLVKRLSAAQEGDHLALRRRTEFDTPDGSEEPRIYRCCQGQHVAAAAATPDLTTRCPLPSQRSDAAAGRGSHRLTPACDMGPALCALRRSAAERFHAAGKKPAAKGSGSISGPPAGVSPGPEARRLRPGG
jgi:hypothetical protein